MLAISLNKFSLQIESDYISKKKFMIPVVEYSIITWCNF